MNKVFIIGNWTKDCELKFTPNNGTAVLTGSLALQRKYAKEGEQQADFINVIIWGKLAENVANYCGSKGNKISIVGRLQSRSYDNKEGKKVYVTEVVAEEVEFLNAKKSTDNANRNIPDDYFGGADITPVDDGEDIPF